jgi:drug/metabolite transporter (DMT)-like permease
MSFQDYINAPMINGYQGLHTTVILHDGTRVRCKIRTKEMHEYAQKGVTTICFKKHGQQLLEALPWMKRIAPLSEDTVDRSDEFWGSLQSDILGESILIHGPADQTVLLPKNATALDGAFYVFGQEAAKTISILVNGQEVPFQTLLKHADTLEIKVTRKLTLQRYWLGLVKTGLAMATIRAKLSEKLPRAEKVLIGKDLLQSFLKERKKGFLEELDEKLLLESFQSLGYTTPDDAYSAIADGRLKTQNAYNAIFVKPALTLAKNILGKQYAVNFSISRDDSAMLHELLSVYEKYHVQQKRLRLWPIPGTKLIRVSWILVLTESEQELLKQQLELHGAQNVELIPRAKNQLLLVLAVIIPWSLNPVLAQWLFANGMEPVSLLTVRFLVFGVFTLIFFLGWRSWKSMRLSPPEGLLRKAMLPSLLNAANSVTTYLALTLIPASVHLSILRFNTLLMPFLNPYKKKSGQFTLLLILIFLAAALLFLLSLGMHLITGIIISGITLLFYTLYSTSIESSFHMHKIDLRQPYLLLGMGLIVGTLGLALLPWQWIELRHHPLLVYAVIYTLVCVCLPHTCYSALLRSTHFKHVTNIFLLEVPLAILFEMLILQKFLPLSSYGVTALLLITLLGLSWFVKTKVNEVNQ